MNTRTSIIPPNQRYSHREAANRISLTDAELWAHRLFPTKKSVRIERMSGGYNNANFFLKYDGDKFLLRLYPAGKDVAQREAAILQLARQAGIKVPEVLDIKVDEMGAAVLQGFVEGSLLSTLIESREQNTGNLFAGIGAELAKIHSTSFPKIGTFSPFGEVQKFAGVTGEDPGLEFLNQFLDGLAGQRLGAERKRDLLSLIKREWHSVRKNFTSPVLVHCDFNPKNILVKDNEVAAIIDWEFAIAGDKLIDFGNFFRFSADYSEVERNSLLAGYKSAGGHIPEEWSEVGRLHDLVSLCSFLGDKEEHPNSFRTA